MSVSTVTRLSFRGFCQQPLEPRGPAGSSLGPLSVWRAQISLCRAGCGVGTVGDEVPAWLWCAAYRAPVAVEPGPRAHRA